MPARNPNPDSKRWPARLLIALAALCLLFLPALAFARAGGGQGFHGGGGGGGGFGGHGGGGGGDGGGDNGLLIYLLFQLIFRYPLVGIPLLIVVAFIFLKTSQQGTSAYRSGVMRRGGAVIDQQSKAAVIDAIRRHDPRFDPDAFFGRVAIAFNKVQAAWVGQDLHPVRPFISDGVYERFSLQFDEQRQAGYRDQLDQLSIQSIDIADIASAGVFDEISLRISAVAVDYRVALADGRFISGSRDVEPFVEIWSFLRKRGTVTDLSHGGLIEGNCPNCGAAIEMNESANCANCKAVLRSGQYDWVLSEITQESEWSRSDFRQVPGLAMLRQRDPGFDSLALEDRASVVFWRSAAADRLGKIDPLRKVASEDYCRTHAPMLRANGGVRTFIGDRAVGGVHVLGFIGETAEEGGGTREEGPARVAAGEDGDSTGVRMSSAPSVAAGSSGNSLERALIDIRWSGTQFSSDGQRATPAGPVLAHTLFILGRKSGAQTDAGKAISSAHCPNCGAPISDQSSNACEYCQTVLNDGAHGWILLDAQGFSSSTAQNLLRQIRQTAAVMAASAGGPPTGAARPGASAATTTATSPAQPFSLRPPPPALLPVGSPSAPLPRTSGYGLVAWAVDVAAADGNVDDPKRAMLAQFAQRRGVSSEQLNHMIDAALQGRLETPTPADRTEAEAWLRAMATVAATHGNLTRQEYTLLRALGDKVGLGDLDVQMLIRQTRASQYAAASAALRAKRDG